MNLVKKYQVGGHCFSLTNTNELIGLYKFKEAYGPFEVSHTAENSLFRLSICKRNVDVKKSLIYSNKERLQEGFIAISIYETNENSMYIELRHPKSVENNACLSLNADFSEAELWLGGHSSEQWSCFNAAVQLCYILTSSQLQTLLMHSSAVIYGERAYLFLGKSGTGKSTHSRMWMNAIDKVILMNDDHPIIRVWPDGRVMAYGSPWSGKTHCYKNIQAPLGGIVRIVRAKQNKVVRLSGIQSYASIISSCSGITWMKELADGRDAAIQSIVSRVPCWNMECLPNEEAAQMCCEVVTKTSI